MNFDGVSDSLVEYTVDVDYQHEHRDAEHEHEEMAEQDDAADFASVAYSLKMSTSQTG